MGKRLTKIYTRTGDDGTSGLADGSRVSKSSPRIEAIGAVDELNSTIGVLLAEELPPTLRSAITSVQHDLFDLGGELSVPGHDIISAAHVARVERELDALNSRLPALTDFVLPGGCRAAAAAHISRAVCRRAERRLVTLAEREAMPPLLIQYLNRLSDFLFVAARALNAHSGDGDVLWEQGK
ncbi:MAG TPA: cob(I)yrinic acid a,c-diamide adenosyltransferase, partial [Burkholderiales bacterium]